MILGSGQRVVFIGDSITDKGRRDTAAPYGDGYVSLVRSFVIASHPELDLTWFNRGISGDTVRHLQARWQEDALELRPDWLSVFIGINDIWRGLGGFPEEAVPIDEFESTLRDLLRQAVDVTGCRLILAEPYVVETDRDDRQRSLTDQYGLVVRKLAEEFDAVNVRTQEAFDRVLVSTKPQDWTNDRIHVDLPGHAVIAQAFLHALGWRPPHFPC